LASALGGNELPSLISAVLGRRWKPSAKGFTSWLDWWSLKIGDQRVSLVFGEIERRNDILASRIFRNSKTFVSNKLWPIIDKIVHHHRGLAEKGKLLSPVERKILATVESTGSIRTDALRRRLDLEGREHSYKFHRSLANLENYSLIIGAEDPNPERHLHANVWQTWEKRIGTVSTRSDLSYREAVEELLGKTVEACVITNERQVREWFRWKSDTEVAQEALLKKDVITRIDSHLLKRDVIDSLSHLR
jgi:hypothetical protein